jgi:hypothetical protein
LYDMTGTRRSACGGGAADAADPVAAATTRPTDTAASARSSWRIRRGAVPAM